jgi:hypothetical protein
LKNWIKNQFIDAHHAMRTISLVSLSLGVIGFAIVVATSVLAGTGGM